MKSNRSSRPEVFFRKGVLKNFTKFTGKHLYQSFFVNKVADLRPAHMFSCEFCEISKNTFFHRTPPVAASSNMETQQKRASFLWSNYQWLLLIITATTVNNSDSNGFNEFKSTISFLLKSLSSRYFLFQLSVFFSLSQSCFIFSCRC